MPFMPHTEEDKQAMLKAIGASSIQDLFDEIPASLRAGTLKEVPESITELELNQLVKERVAQIQPNQCFLGAGAYEHHIPAAVWDITSRGEFLTAYTPYQAEASQGSLQLIYEFQTMMCALTAMDVANASLYDGASALAEAVLMAVRAQKKRQAKGIVLASSLHPFYRETVETIVQNQNIELIEVDFNEQSGTTMIEQLAQVPVEQISALVISQPNFFGCLEDVDKLTDWAHSQGAIVIGCVNPTSLALLKPPGQWGELGADIVCGEGQPLGVPLASGGPYFGFLTCKQSLVRQMPGRIVGRTTDVDGKEGFTLTLQAREQHIRRSKAKSNICTNQGLLVTAATVYLSLMGAQGLKTTATQCHENTAYLVQELVQLSGIQQRFNAPYFHEAVLTFNYDVNDLLTQLAARGITGGYPLGQYFQQLQNDLLICVTETKTKAELDAYVHAVEDIIK